MIAGAIPIAAGAIAVGMFDARLGTARPDLFGDFVEHVARDLLILFDVLLIASRIGHGVLHRGSVQGPFPHAAPPTQPSLSVDSADSRPEPMSDLDVDEIAEAN